jgi:hypothetical protein
MKKILAIAFVVALVAVLAFPAFAAPRGRGGGRGPGAAVAATIPAEVHTAIQTATREAAAKALGMTPEALAQEFAAGKTMVALAAAKNVPVATVRAAMVTARNAAIDSALQAGRITAEQAAWLKQAGPSGGFGMGDGPGRGRPGRGGRGPGQGPRW